MLRFFSSPACRDHDLGPALPETPHRLEGILRRLAEEGLAEEEVTAHGGAGEAIERMHDPRYMDRFRRAVERGDGLLDSADNRRR